MHLSKATRYMRELHELDIDINNYTGFRFTISINNSFSSDVWFVLDKVLEDEENSV